jgi:hypothetical protein
LTNNVKDSKFFSKYVLEFLPPTIIPSVFCDHHHHHHHHHWRPFTAESGINRKLKLFVLIGADFVIGL